MKQLLASIFLLTVLLSACEQNDLDVIEMVAAKEQLPSETSTNIRLLYSDSGLVRLMVAAPKLDRYTVDTAYVEFTEGVEVEFYDSEGAVETRLTANYAIQWEQDGLMEARNDVVVVNKDGDRLNTEHLHWNRNKRKILSEAFVKITTEEQILWGDGLEANEDFSEYRILNPKGQLYIREEADSTTATPSPESPEQ